MGAFQNITDRVRRAYMATLRQPAALPAPPTAHRSDDRRVVRHDAGSIVNPLTKLGSSGDKGSVARPNTYVLPLDDEELRALYKYNGIARRIVDIQPEHACRNGWNVPGVVPVEEKQLRIQEKVLEALLMAELFGGAAMVLFTIDDVPSEYDTDPKRWLEQPLDLRRVGELRAVQVFDSFEAHPLEIDLDPWSPDYRSPKYWSIGAHGFHAKIHGSRVLHFRGRHRIPSERWQGSGFGGFGSWSRQQDDSFLQVVWEEIHRLGTTMQGAAVLAQELQKSVFQIKGLDVATTSEAQADVAAHFAAMSRLQSVLGATVIGAEDSFHHVAGTPHGFRDLSEGARQMLSMVTGYPQMVLFGDAPAGFSTDGESGWEGFRQRISTYQERYVRGPLERLYQVLGAAQDSKSEIDPDDPGLSFKPLSEPDDLGRAQVYLTTAQADAIMVQNGVLSPEEVRRRFEDEGYVTVLEGVEPLDDMQLAARDLMTSLASTPPALRGGPPQTGDPNQPPIPAK